MRSPNSFDRFLSTLISGDRPASRQVLREEVAQLSAPSDAYEALLWPAMAQLEALYVEDRINAAAHALATRILRSLVDQVQTLLTPAAPTGRQVIIACPAGETEELGAQMAADLLESRGWKVAFLGGGVPGDEILGLVGTMRPDVLMLYGTQPSGVPEVRRLVDLIRDVGVQPTMNILVSGGVFNRAEGLWNEVNADYFAPDIRATLDLIETAPPRDPDDRLAGASRKRRRRRRPEEALTA